MFVTDKHRILDLSVCNLGPDVNSVIGLFESHWCGSVPKIVITCHVSRHSWVISPDAIVLV